MDAASANRASPAGSTNPAVPNAVIPSTRAANAGQVQRDRQVLVGVDREVGADLDAGLPSSAPERLHHHLGDLGGRAQPRRVELRFDRRFEVADAVGGLGADQCVTQGGEVVEVMDQVRNGAVGVEERPDIREGVRPLERDAPLLGERLHRGERVGAVQVHVDVHLRQRDQVPSHVRSVSARYFS
jgi:hypothetical protein